LYIPAEFFLADVDDGDGNDNQQEVKELFSLKIKNPFAMLRDEKAPGTGLFTALPSGSFFFGFLFVKLTSVTFFFVSRKLSLTSKKPPFFKYQQQGF
jgi:hypothetical protein